MALAVGSVSALEQATSAALAPVVAEARVAVPQAAAANLDETGWRAARNRGWRWTVVTTSLTVCHIDAGRGGRVAQALLGARWAGIVGADRGTMDTWPGGERRQVCWAHRKRDCQKLVHRSEGSRPIGTGLLAVEAAVFRLWHRFRREEIDRAALQQVLVEAVAAPNDTAAGVCHAVLKVWPAWGTFV